MKRRTGSRERPTPDDARRAVDLGADSIVVSNHGGRQLDGVPGTLDVLPEIVAAVGGAPGVDAIWTLLVDELERAMRLVACRTIAELTPDVLPRIPPPVLARSSSVI